MGLPKSAVAETKYERQGALAISHVLRRDYRPWHRGRPQLPPERVELVDLLDALLGEALPEAVYHLGRVQIEFKNYEFECRASSDGLQLKKQFQLVRKYLSETFNTEVSERAAINVLLKLIVEMYPSMLYDLPMDKIDSAAILSLETLEPKLHLHIPIRGETTEAELPIDIKTLMDQVPASLKKVYQGVAEWKTREEAAELEQHEPLSEGTLKAFSLM